MRMKKFLVLLFMSVFLICCNQATVDSSDSTSSSVGAICYDDGTYSYEIEVDKTPVGIAFECDKDGRPTKIVHLEQSSNNLRWCLSSAEAYGKELSTSTTDGSVNWQVICNAVSDEDVSGNYPAFEYVNGLTEYGGNWYLPANDELDEIYLAMDAINDALKKLSKAKYNTETLSSRYLYWSSSAVYNNGAWNQYFGDGKQNFDPRARYYDWYGNYYRVRAVRVF